MLADEVPVTSQRISRAAHAPGRALAPLLLGLLASLLLAAPAGAIVVKVKVGGGTSTVGVQPPFESVPLDGNGEGGGGAPEAANFNNPAASPGPVMHSVNAYVIYWDPQDLYHGEWQGLIDRYMSTLSGASEKGGNDVFSVDTQYTDTSGGASGKTRFLGAYTDTAPYPAAGCTDKLLPALPPEVTCLTDAQIQLELRNFIVRYGLQTGMGTLFFVLTPPGVGVCVDGGAGASHCSQDNGGASPKGFCSYHSYYSEAPVGTVLYAAIPWTAGDFGGFPGETDGDLCQTGGWIENETTGGFEEVRTPQEPNQLPVRGGDGLWDEGLADMIVGQMGAEQQNAITDPLLNAWQDREKLGGEEIGYENTDECRGFFLPKDGGSWKAKKHTEAGNASNQELGESNFFLLNDAFDLAALKLSYPGVPCLPGIRLEPAFTEPPTVKSGEIVGFDGMESDITLNAGERFAGGEEKPTYPTFVWNFGDGTPPVSGYAPGAPPAIGSSLCDAPWLAPCAASVFHTYQYGGVYNVTLTVTDIAGNTASTARAITVEGPPPPMPSPQPGGPGTGTGTGAAAGSGAAGSAGASSAAVPPGPVASAAAVSNSLKQVLRSGLVVRYAVNQQVAGHFEVLLNAATAKRLRISGSVASNLPAGFPRSLVIGRALLVTTRGGHSSVRIRFSKRTAARLRHVRSVTLTLRLIVHNASNPVSTTVISTVVLHH